MPFTLVVEEDAHRAKVLSEASAALDAVLGHRLAQLAHLADDLFRRFAVYLVTLGQQDV